MEHLCIDGRQEGGKVEKERKSLEMNWKSKEKTVRKQREERNVCMRESILLSLP